MIRSALMLVTVLTLGGCTALSKISQIVIDPSTPVGAPGDQLSQFSLSLYAAPTLNINPHSVRAEAPLAELSEPSPLALNLNAADPAELTLKLQMLLERLQSANPAHSTLEAGEWKAPPMSPLIADPLGMYAIPNLHLSSPEQVGSPSNEVTTPVEFQLLQLKDDSVLLSAGYDLLANNLKKTLGSTLLQADNYVLVPGQFKFVDLETIQEETRYLAVIANYHDHDSALWKSTLRIAPRGRRHALFIRFADDGVTLQDEGPSR